MDRLIPQSDVLTLVHSDEYASWVFDPSHPAQGRRFLNAADRLRALAPAHGIELAEIEADYFPSFEKVDVSVFVNPGQLSIDPHQCQRTRLSWTMDTNLGIEEL